MPSTAEKSLSKHNWPLDHSWDSTEKSLSKHKRSAHPGRPRHVRLFVSMSPGVPQIPSLYLNLDHHYLKIIESQSFLQQNMSTACSSLQEIDWRSGQSLLQTWPSLSAEVTRFPHRLFFRIAQRQFWWSHPNTQRSRFLVYLDHHHIWYINMWFGIVW